MSGAKLNFLVHGFQLFLRSCELNTWMNLFKMPKTLNDFTYPTSPNAPFLDFSPVLSSKGPTFKLHKTSHSFSTITWTHDQCLFFSCHFCSLKYNTLHLPYHQCFDTFSCRLPISISFSSFFWDFILLFHMDLLSHISSFCLFLFVCFYELGETSILKEWSRVGATPL